jgi:hypothetical protein
LGFQGALLTDILKGYHTPSGACCLGLGYPRFPKIWQVKSIKTLAFAD